MDILVRKDGEVWVAWTDTAMVDKTWTTANQTYADGRQIEVTVPPYTVPQALNGTQVKSWYDQGIWTAEEVTAVGGRWATSFEMPEGKQAAGPERFEEDEEGNIFQVYDVEDIPEPPPPPTVEEKYQAFLDSIGLSHVEFMSMLT